MEKPANTTYPIIDAIRRRWSPRAFDGSSVPAEVLEQCAEAARWAPSASNTQPWRFVAATQSHEAPFAHLLETLAGGNKIWAHKAGALVAVIGATQNEDGEPYKWFAHDCGQAAAYFTLEAMNQGVFSHQMAGFSQEQAHKTLQLSDSEQVCVMIALGYPTDPATLPNETLQARETAERTRKSISQVLQLGW